MTVYRSYTFKKKQEVIIVKGRKKNIHTINLFNQELRRGGTELTAITTKNSKLIP